MIYQFSPGKRNKKIYEWIAWYIGFYWTSAQLSAYIKHLMMTYSSRSNTIWKRRPERGTRKLFGGILRFCTNRRRSLEIQYEYKMKQLIKQTVCHRLRKKVEPPQQSGGWKNCTRIESYTQQYPTPSSGRQRPSGTKQDIANRSESGSYSSVCCPCNHTVSSSTRCRRLGLTVVKLGVLRKRLEY